MFRVFKPNMALLDGILAIAVSVLLLVALVDSKVVNIDLDSSKAAQEKGQYLTKFCFRGQTGVVRYSVNETISGGSLYLFYDEVWHKALAAETCADKLQMASVKLDLSGDVAGERTMAQWFEPHFWYILYADAKTCLDDPNVAVQDAGTQTYVQAELVFLNPDSSGQPKNHFSVDMNGLSTFYQLLLIVHIFGGYFFLSRLWSGISKGGPLNSAVKMVTAAALLQIFAIFFMTANLWRYSSDGVGWGLFKRTSEFLDLVSQFLMLSMLISLALGWTMGSRNKHIWDNKMTIGGLTMVAAVMLWLFFWEQTMDEQHYGYRSHLTRPDILAVVLRLLVAIVFTVNLQATLVEEKSSLKREFYSQLAAGCYVWFFSYPLVVIVGYFFSECRRHSAIVIGSGVSQSVALLMLCRMFLTRSLYWSVSSLGAPMLPLRTESSTMLHSDTGLRHKSYGSSAQ